MSGVFFYWLSRGHRIVMKSFEIASPGHAQSLAEVAPSCSVNKANEKSNQLTTTPIPFQGDIHAPGFGQASSSTNIGKKCTCIVCLAIGVYDSSNYGPEHCHVVSCKWKSACTWLIAKYKKGPKVVGKDRAAHAKTHYQQGQGPEKSQPFHCPVEDCRYSAKRWSDLRRHTTATHCKNPAMFECSVIGCRYHGEGNGFTRKDKLTAHYRSMHNGQRVPGQVVRTLQPAQASSYTEALVSGSVAGQQW